jgi:hypothetical protein
VWLCSAKLVLFFTIRVHKQAVRNVGSGEQEVFGLTNVKSGISYFRSLEQRWFLTILKGNIISSQKCCTSQPSSCERKDGLKFQQLGIWLTFNKFGCASLDLQVYGGGK